MDGIDQGWPLLYPFLLISCLLGLEFFGHPTLDSCLVNSFYSSYLLKVTVHANFVRYFPCVYFSYHLINRSLPTTIPLLTTMQQPPPPTSCTKVKEGQTKLSPVLFIMGLSCSSVECWTVHWRWQNKDLVISRRPMTEKVFVPFDSYFLDLSELSTVLCFQFFFKDSLAKELSLNWDFVYSLEIIGPNCLRHLNLHLTHFLES